MSPAAATASPAAGAETVADLAPEASTELTPGAPTQDERRTAEATEGRDRINGRASDDYDRVPRNAAYRSERTCMPGMSRWKADK